MSHVKIKLDLEQKLNISQIAEIPKKHPEADVAELHKDIASNNEGIGYLKNELLGVDKVITETENQVIIHASPLSAETPLSAGAKVSEEDAPQENAPLEQIKPNESPKNPADPTELEMKALAENTIQAEENLIKLQEKLQNQAPSGTLVWLRNYKDCLKPIPELKMFSETQNIAIKNDMRAKISRSWTLGYADTIASQTAYLDASLTEDLLKSTQLNEDITTLLIENPGDIRTAFLNLLIYGYNIVTATKPSNAAYYTNLFKDSLGKLQKLFGKQGAEQLQTILLALANNTDFLGILPLVYQIEAQHDASLEPFITAETFGHHVPYKVEKDPLNIKSTFIIYDQDGKPVEHYKIKAISVMKTHRGKITTDRDLGLIGSILVPDDLETAEVPTLYVCWKGTDDKHTGKADIEIRAGAESYRRGERQVLEQICAAIKECQGRLPEGKKLKVIVAGHSLGGALSQLCLNSLQRIMVQDLAKGDNSLNTQVQSLEKTFRDAECALISGVDHQQIISDITIGNDIISGLTLDVANAAGVSPSVQAFSNELSKILVDKGVEQAANYIKISSDPVGVSGQGILNKVPDNKAKVSILYIEREILHHYRTTLASTGSLFLPAAIVGTGGVAVGVLGAALAAGVVYRAKTDRHESHTQWQFKENHRPSTKHAIHNTHNLDGSLNDNVDCKFIDNQLSNQSPVVNFFSWGLSYSNSSDIRNDSLCTKGIIRFEKALEEAKSSKEKLAVLIAELDTATIGHEERLLTLLETKEHQELLTEKNDNEDSLLSYAIKTQKYAFAEKLVPLSNAIINLPNKEGKTPFLVCLDKINDYIRSVGDSAAAERQLARLLLTEGSGVDLALNNQAILAKQVLNQRCSFGTVGTAFRQFFVDLDIRLNTITNNVPIPNLLMSTAANNIHAPELPLVKEFRNHLQAAMEAEQNSAMQVKQFSTAWALIIKELIDPNKALFEVDACLNAWKERHSSAPPAGLMSLKEELIEMSKKSTPSPIA